MIKARFARRLTLCAALSIGGAAALVEPVSAAKPEPRTLQELCESRGGDYYFTPYHFARCQEARPRRNQADPLAAEREICADTYGGTITSAPSTNRPRRVNWVCG